VVSLVPVALKKLAQAVADHRLRHTPTGFQFALADRVDYLDAASWDRAVSGASVFLSRDYLRALAAAPPENLRPRFALVFRGAAPVAAVAAQSLEVDGARLVREEGTALRRLAARSVSKLKASVLVCGNLLSWGAHGAAFAPGEDPAALWPAVAEALYRIRRAEKLSGETDLVVVKDLPPGAGEALRPYSYAPQETEPDMVLDLPAKWKDHKDYLAGLTSSYRQAAKKVFKEIEAAGIVVDRTLDAGAVADRLHALYLQVHGNAALRPVTLSPGYLPSLQGALGERFRLATLRRAGEILGFVSTIKDGDTAVGYYMGFDRAAAESAPLYLRLLQATVEDAIALGCRRLSLGRTALDPKSRLGAKPAPMQIWVRHRLPWLNVLVKGIAGSVPHAEAPERNPFKEEKTP
jgi:hypothetical protein